jgi:D-beta-D-heptose 7-phosphate kinase/D-beta-D-heptose 1-phosphate adenosyltransferase
MLAPHLPPTDDLIRLLDRWHPPTVLVVGDYMLDHHVQGSADRLSPDAPVPVLAMRGETYAPGGAANVALDLIALDCKVVCLGVTGQDDTAHRLRDALSQQGCDVAGLVASPDRPTTIKHNFVGLAQHRHPQKMFRVDSESKAPVPEAIARKLIQHAEKHLKKCDAKHPMVLCIEDYNKGVCTPGLCQALIAAARKHNVPVLVDPAAVEDYTRYRGATTITPNRYEAALATGMSGNATDLPSLTAIARKLRRQLQLATVVLTLDKQGALLLNEKNKATHLPTTAREVYDVTGAGDMVLAMLAAALGNGATWPQAVSLANVAGGLEVEKFGVVPIPLSDILLALLRQNHQQLGKVRTLAQLLPELDAYRRQGKSIAFTNGCFDILHAGHVQFLRAARQAGDLLVVGLNSDASITRLKGPSRPVNHLADRVMVLSELQSVDYIVVFEQDTPRKLIEAIKPDALVKGADYRKDQVVGADLVERHGGKVVLVDLVEGRSTTNLIRKLSDNR